MKIFEKIRKAIIKIKSKNSLCTCRTRKIGDLNFRDRSPCMKHRSNVSDISAIDFTVASEYSKKIRKLGIRRKLDRG